MLILLLTCSVVHGATIEDILAQAGVLNGCTYTIPPAEYSWNLSFKDAELRNVSDTEAAYYYAMFYYDPWPSGQGSYDAEIAVTADMAMPALSSPAGDGNITELSAGANSDTRYTVYSRWHNPVFWNSCFHYSRNARGYSLNFRPRTITSGRTYHFDSTMPPPKGFSSGKTSGKWPTTVQGADEPSPVNIYPRGYTLPRKKPSKVRRLKRAYSDSKGRYSRSKDTHSKPSSSYSPPGNNYSKPSSSYSPPGNNYSKPSSSYSPPGNNYSKPSSSDSSGARISRY